LCATLPVELPLTRLQALALLGAVTTTHLATHVSQSLLELGAFGLLDGGIRGSSRTGGGVRIGQTRKDQQTDSK
jgi:hypothetical protein